MKKKILCLVMLLCVLLVPFTAEAKTTKKTKKKTTTTTTVAAAKQPVNFYIFYGSTCGYCASLHAYTATLEKDSTINYMFNIVDYEVWADSTNANLMAKVGEYFNKEVKGVPFYVIGDKTFDGYATSMNEEIRATIEEAYKNQAKDVVATIGTGNVLKYVGENTGTQVTPTNTNNSSSKTAAYIIVGVTVIIILLIVFGRSKDESYYEDEEEELDDDDDEDDDEDEDDEEEEEEKPRQAAKKTQTKVVKKTSSTKGKSNRTTSTKTGKRK